MARNESHSDADVVVERHGAVMLIRLNRPDRGNALGGTMLRDLAAAFDDAGRDDSVHAVVTTGMGKSFCVGADVADLPKVADLPAREMLASDTVGGFKGLPSMSPRQRELDDVGNAGRVAWRLWSLEKPTIAAINGAAIGGGFAIALLHDIRIATDDAKLGSGFAALGVAPELGITYLLPRIVGASTAADLLLRADTLSGAAARDAGLLSEAVPPDRLVDRAMEIAGQIAANSPLATGSAKRLLRRSWDSDFLTQLRAEYTEQVRLFDHPETRDTIRETVRRLGEHR